MTTTAKTILRRRMHGLYLSRRCEELETLAHELLGLHCWFYRNVPFSALIRGADITGIKTRLTKTWLYRGTLHGVLYEDLPELLALSGRNHEDGYSLWLAEAYGAETIREITDEVLRLMEDGVYSRTEFRSIFAERYEPEVIRDVFSPWGGVFVHLARLGKVAFKDMTSRDFDLISAESALTLDDVLPRLLDRYFRAYGPATLGDAAYFLGIGKENAKRLKTIKLDHLDTLSHDGKTYYYSDEPNCGDIPKLTLLSGFDPFIVSYTADNRFALPQEYKSRVILKSGICLPTIAVDGQVAGLWNIKKKEPYVEFFTPQAKEITSAAWEMVESILWQTEGGFML